MFLEFCFCFVFLDVSHEGIHDQKVLAATEDNFKRRRSRRRRRKKSEKVKEAVAILVFEMCIVGRTDGQTELRAETISSAQK